MLPILKKFCNPNKLRMLAFVLKKSRNRDIIEKLFYCTAKYGGERL